MQLPVTATAVIETALNHYISLDPQGTELFEKMQGKVLAIDFLGLDLSLFFIPGLDRMHIMSLFDGETDARLRGAPGSLLRMGLASHSESQLFSGDIEIIGDTELAQNFQTALEQLDIDWEEHLSHITGDVIAHQIGRGLRGLFKWGQQVQDSFVQNSAEYLTEEADLVASDYELEKFNQAVDQLRTDFDRLQARVNQLKNL